MIYSQTDTGMRPTLCVGQSMRLFWQEARQWAYDTLGAFGARF
jgi:hypothetical protein